MVVGVGIYISSSRSDLSVNSDEAESCRIEILQEHKPNMTVGCIYRHPSSNLDNFTSQLEIIISSLYQSKHHVFSVEDNNIDFLIASRYTFQN